MTFASADSVKRALEEGVKHVIDDREVDAKVRKVGHFLEAI